MAYDESVLKLVVTRISVMPPNVSFSIGGHGTFTRDQLVAEVKKHSKTGEAIVRMELNFIKEMPRLSAALSE